MNTLLPFSTALFIMGATMSSAASVTNGSLTGPTATGGLPTGWTTTSESPDTVDVTANVGCCSFGSVTPIASPDGGTWIGFARDGSFNETFGQLIAGLVPGAAYDLSFYASNFGYEPFGYTASNAVSAFIDGTSIGTTAVLDLEDPWLLSTFTFIAPSASTFLSFELASTSKSYLGIDGVELAPATATIPLPATALLLLGATVGLAGLKRQNRV